MKCSLGISNFLEKISSVSHSVVFLYLFALIAEEGFLISPCYSLELHTACCDSVFKVGRFHIVFSLIEDVFNTMHVCMLSHFSYVRLFDTLWAVVHQAPLSMGFSRQEHWSGLPCPSAGDLTDPGIEPKSPESLALAGDSLQVMELI